MRQPFLLAAAIAAVLACPSASQAHCDALDGPVVKDARAALEKKDVTPALKWVAARDEKEVRDVFAKVQAARAAGGAAREVADRLFFETLVRVHRASEGEPYTGLLPSGTPMEPGVAEADAALESGSVEALAKELAREVEQGVRERFARAADTKSHADEPEHGRHFVAAYVDYVHFVRGLKAATAKGAHAHAH